jgi:hypothetical protein
LSTTSDSSSDTATLPLKLQTGINIEYPQKHETQPIISTLAMKQNLKKIIFKHTEVLREKRPKVV